MINPHWLELPMSRINFHGPKDARAIEVLLYFAVEKSAICGAMIYVSSNIKAQLFKTNEVVS